MKKSTKIFHKNAVFGGGGEKKFTEILRETRRVLHISDSWIGSKGKKAGKRRLEKGRVAGAGRRRKQGIPIKKGLTKSPRHGKIFHTIMNVQTIP